MRRRMIVPILVGLALILNTFISTVSVVQKIAYAQVRTEPSSGVPVDIIPASKVVGSNGRNSVVQVVPGGGSSGALSTDGQSITAGPREIVAQGSHSIGTVVQNIQQTVQNIQKIAGASIVVAGVVLLGSITHAIKKHQEMHQGGHIVPIVPISNIPNFHP